MARHRKPDTDDLDCTLRESYLFGTLHSGHNLEGDSIRISTTSAVDVESGVGSVHSRRGGAHRRQSRSRPGGRALVLSVATGALLAAGTSASHASAGSVSAPVELDQQPLAPLVEQALASAPEILQVPKVADLGKLAEQLARGTERDAERASREEAARQPLTMAPVSGTLTSNYGPRWGSTHYGLDIANEIGTPIVSVTDGTVLESGPASGFGLWVRILQDDGTIGVFGHINETLVTAGQKVRAGELIATVGNRGQSTGPHLHYEVWQADGQKVDPMAWLDARGVQIQPPAISD
ncbi:MULTISPECIES: M23 family metallopeptidase [Rhodococcus]|uniref:M23 family metallopeptidase n=1 Tax=Rhodococcus baikonurensis TaxID=172041 RepID=A0ABV5XVD8_9NOCA|nr:MULTISPECIES: M23 family metallopeptidase [Rhodococcus]MCJ0901126.1 M23 family metallopeptidase [Rhodococcus sp. ARC_M13]MCT6736374.1 M23 family metallopeptidase [Rhodococcus qingshengii]MDJ0435020.1 M23 family metallopeptidase [Rhodococcus qingshengii]MDV8128744.1 M23 family metallopeptidase [Rhodococcus sp. IEGM 1304]UGQ55904.1 M23 family metallopeptidase [Rhodococcus qingshengii]